MRIFLDLHDTSDYLGSEARRRGIDERELCRRLMNQIVRDKMVLAVLDDDGAANVRQPAQPASRVTSSDRRQVVLRTLREQGRPSTIKEIGGNQFYATVRAMVDAGELICSQPVSWPPTKFYSLPSSPSPADCSAPSPRGVELPPAVSPATEGL